MRKLNKSLEALIEKDVSKIIQMCGVYIKIFLCESAQNNMDFHADFHFIENLYKKHIIQEAYWANESAREGRSISSRRGH